MIADILRPIDCGICLFDTFLKLECASYWGWFDLVTLTCLHAGWWQ